jgi:hypothetical protein
VDVQTAANGAHTERAIRQRAETLKARGLSQQDIIQQMAADGFPVWGNWALRQVAAGLREDTELKQNIWVAEVRARGWVPEAPKVEDGNGRHADDVGAGQADDEAEEAPPLTGEADDTDTDCDHEIDDTDADLAVFDHEPALEAAKAPPLTAIALAQAESDAIRNTVAVKAEPPLLADALPDALRPLAEQSRWLLWQWEKDQRGKPTKVPYQPNGKKASSTDPKTWSSFASVWAAREKFDGVGFCLHDSSEFGAFDLDDCRDANTGNIDPWAKALVARAGSYAEVTVSGTGLRIIGRATGPMIHRKQPVVNGSTLETYRRAERYIVMTGNALPGSPQALADIDSVMEEVVAELDQKKQGKASGRDGQQGETEELSPKLVSMLSVVGSGGYQSRSELMFAFLGEALRKRVKPEVVVDACVDEKYRGSGIHEHCRENGGRDYALRQIKRAREKVESNLEYEARADGTYWRKHTESGNVWVKLANFSAKVVEDVVMDDGSVEEQRIFVIEGSLGRARVSADSFDSTRWDAGARHGPALPRRGQEARGR